MIGPTANNGSTRKPRVRVEWSKNLQDQLSNIVDGQAELVKSQGTLEIRLLEKMELNHNALSRDLGLLRNDVTDLRASYNADKAAYERRFFQLESRPASTWEADKQSVVQRLEALEARPKEQRSQFSLNIALAALIASSFFNILTLVLSILIAKHAI